MSGQTQRHYSLKNIKCYKEVIKYLPIGLRAISDVSICKNVLKKKKRREDFLFFYPSLNSGLEHCVLFMLVNAATAEISFNLFLKL